MKRSHRHTIMDGRVVTFAMDFKKGDGIFGDSFDAVGPFEISASRNMVVVHKANITELSHQDFLTAFNLAIEEHRFLETNEGRPDDNDRGEAREVTSSTLKAIETGEKE